MESFDERIAEVNDEIRALASTVEPDSLAESVVHVSTSGGKRVRPVLTTLACEAVTGDSPTPDQRDAALRFAVGVEFVHTSALVADDIIDRSDVRRGVPTVHEGFGHDPAVLTSNVLLGKALETIDDREAVAVMVDAVKNLGEGEAMELAGDVRVPDDYVELARKKTGSLFVAACEVGGIAGDGSDDELCALRDYGRHLGVAFQIRDDVLDYTASEEALGKPVGKDAVLERPSLVALHSRENDARLSDSVEFARDRADEHVNRASEALDRLDPTDASDEMRSLTGFAVDRSN
ncbi:polyprenyl synthetase family protein [Haladaptatus sp. F3-133]|jgi:geranylgeranyl diphosphate synthase type I|uniref:Polyprenyl synthetase family protein n=1 Tax=Halorutilus salinus TaxID=2487751 RepID=A0A9Q4C7S0_9EURY|nr:polyprenyl synthetase family protein [Halorutilus salinus]MCX2819969.1 polyprenyl synthetase family protein [Halorutilus salinus]